MFLQNGLEKQEIVRVCWGKRKTKLLCPGVLGCRCLRFLPLGRRASDLVEGYLSNNVVNGLFGVQVRRSGGAILVMAVR
jgi:hypothetical protein